MKKSHVYLVDQIEKKLLDYFAENNLQIGDTIPKEMELVDILGVSRTVVRESLSRLRTQGLLETKRRKGTVLKNPDISVVLEKSLNPALLNEDTLKDYFELRLSLEVGMSDLIMQRRTRKDILELKEILRMQPDNAHQIFATEYEIKFHSKLYSITRNESMMKFQKLLLPLFDYVHNSGMLDLYNPTENFVTHEQIVDVIEYGNADELRKTMRLHLDPHYRRLSSIQKQKLI